MRRDVIGAVTAFEWTDDRRGNWHGGVALYDAIAPVTVRATAPCTVPHVPRALRERLAGVNAHLAFITLRGVQGGGSVLYRHAPRATLRPRLRARRRDSRRSGQAAIPTFARPSSVFG